MSLGKLASKQNDELNKREVVTVEIPTTLIEALENMINKVEAELGETISHAVNREELVTYAIENQIGFVKAYHRAALAKNKADAEMELLINITR